MAKEIDKYTEPLNGIINTLKGVNENEKIEQTLKEIVAELEKVVEQEYFKSDNDKTKMILFPQVHEGELAPNTYRICYHQALINVAISKGYDIENIVNIIEANESDTAYLNGQTSGVPNTIKNIDGITNIKNSLVSGEFLRAALVTSNGMELIPGDISGKNMTVSQNSPEETIHSTPEQNGNYDFNVSDEGMLIRDQGMIEVSNNFFAEATASRKKHLAIFPVGASHKISDKIKVGDGVLLSDTRFLGYPSINLDHREYDFYRDNKELGKKVYDVSNYIDSEPKLNRKGNKKEKCLKGGINEERLEDVLDILASTKPSAAEREIQIDRSRG